MTTPPEEPRRRLARLIEERATDLRLTWDEVIERSGLSKQGLHGVRFGTGALRRLTKAGIEDALAWKRGSVDAILKGGDPTVVDEAPLIPEPEAEAEDVDYPDFVGDDPFYRHIWRFESVSEDDREYAISGVQLHRLRQAQVRNVGGSGGVVDIEDRKADRA
ncbi:hypothetical protein [Actinomadura nitritigenes]|uniref:hypothetical protein n=1 Tax=Actinomadura nitritigenes TaxID=134602 RepID=UPI003D8BD1C2